MTPNWLTIMSGMAGMVGVVLSIYVIIDAKIGAKKKKLDEINGRIIDHENRISKTERITGIVEESMEDLLLEHLMQSRRPRRK